MQITDKLNDQITKAVQVSMQIEGYPPTRSKPIKDEARKLMERQRVQVSISKK